MMKNYRNLGLTMLVCALFSLPGKSQADYSFSASSGTFVAINGSDTASEIHADTKLGDSLAIGFNFVYAGKTYTHLKPSSNGFITFDNSSTNSQTTNNLDGLSEPIIAPLWDDLDGRATGGSYASYVVTGTAPNRVFTFEWLNWEWYYSSTTGSISFQVKLYETSNKIEFVYRPESGTVTTSASASVGLTGIGTGSGTYLSVDTLATTATVSSTTEETNIEIKPASGLTFTFNPPTCPAPHSYSVSSITSSGASIGFSAGSATNFQYNLGTPGVTPGSGSIVSTTSNPFTLTGLTPATTYDVHVRNICGAGDSSIWTKTTFTTSCLAKTAPYSENFDSYSSGDVPICWTAINTTGNSSAYSEVTTTNNSAPRGYRLYNSSATTGELGVVLPEFSDLTSKQNMLRFDLRVSSSSAPTNLIIGTVSHPDSIGTFAPFDTILDTELTSTWQTFEVLFDSSYTGTHKYIYLKHDLGSTFDYLYFDNISYLKTPYNDAGINSLKNSTFCPGSAPVIAILENFGKDTLKSATINWSVAVNSGTAVSQTPFSWTGNLAEGDTAHVNIGNYTFSSANSYDLVVYTSSPNGTTDDGLVNDTLELTNLGTALSGTYTLGGTSPDYATFAALSTDLQNKGLCGATKILVRQGTYNEQISFTNIGGLSSSNTLEIVADQANTAAAKITYAASGSADNYTIGFDGVSYITIDSLEIEATGTSYARAVQFEGMNNNISLTNNTITGLSTTSTSSNLAVIYDNSGSSNVNENLTISNNEIKNGSYGVYLYGIGSTSFEDGLTFTDNEVVDYHYYGVYSYYQSNAKFAGNYIEDADSYTSPYGLRLYYNDTVEVYDNEIYIGGTSGPYGIYLYYCDGSTTKPVKVYNNMISMYSTTASSTVYGLYAYQGEENQIYYNSVAVHGGSTSARAMYIVYSTGDNAQVKNNSFANFGGGYAVYASTTSGLSSSDYNNLYSTGTNVGYWSGNRTDLSAYQTASSMETNSVSGDPVHKGLMDLRSKSTALDGNANPISGYTTDIFGTTRNTTTPDIGAHEFTPPANDVGVIAIESPANNDCGQAVDPVLVRIKNFGTAAQSSIPVSATVSGGISTTLSATFSGTLASGADTVVSLGNLNTASGVTITINARTTHTGDLDSDNDTLMSGSIKLNAIPNAPTASGFSICAGSDTTVIASGGSTGYRWYTEDEGGTLLSSTDTLSITNLLVADTFYVETYGKSSASVGAANNSIGSGGTYTAFTDGLVFDASAEFVLDSVDVVVGGAGNVVIRVVNSSSTVIGSSTVAVSGAGTFTIPVGVTVPKGTGYELDAVGSTVNNLYRNSGGGVYPYTDPSGSVSITGPINNLSGYYYFFYNWKVTVNGCPSPRAGVVMNTIAAPVVNLGNDTMFCSTGSISLTLDATTTGATYKWNDNSTNATLNASATGTYWAQVTSSAGCVGTDTLVISNFAPTAVSFPNLSNVCANADTFSITGATPVGGTYSGTGVTNGVFDPTVAGSGSKSLYYSFTDANSCTYMDTASITVDTVPVITTSNIPSVCEGGSPIIPSYASPSGGTYSGDAIQFGAFIPDSGTVGRNLVIYEYTDGNGCKDTSMNFITIHSLPSTSLRTASNLCLNDTAIQITGGLPVGGTYMINGVVDSILRPMNIGLDTVSYTYTDANSCTNTATAFIRIDSVPVATFATINPACVGSGQITLTQGAPFGGVYSGNNVASGVYNPNTVGTDTLTYIFADKNGCVDTVTQTVTVNALPNVTLSAFSGICENAGLFALSGGMPAGGMYTGANVSGANFNPANAGAGIDTITYVFTDGNNCSNSAKRSIEVFAAPNATLSAIAAFCDNGSARTLTEGAPAGGTYSGTGITGSSFDPKLGTVGNNTVTYIVTNANCADTATGTIVIEAAPVFTITGTLEGCGENMPTLKTTVSGLTYAWSTGSTADSVQVSTTGKVYVTVTDNTGSAQCSSSDTVDVVYDEICSGIAGLNTFKSVAVYPNPSNGSFTVALEGINETEVTIEVISANGQLVYSAIETISGQELASSISLNNVENGLYFVRIKGENAASIERITINK